MALLTATIEMRAPEEHRERLHDLVTATSMVMVMSCAPGPGALVGDAAASRTGEVDGMPMALVRTADDTTMYVATALDAAHAETLERDPRVMVVVPGEDYALFTADAVVSRDRALIDSLWNESWRRWFRSKSDPAIAIIILSPIEGSYWEGGDRHSYIYRLVGTIGSRRKTQALSR
jgi:general stress protein 26